MFQVFPDYVKEVPEEQNLKKNSNPRYKFFKQNYFTAGDFDQFLQYWNPYPCYNQQDNYPKYFIHDHPNLHLDMYKELCTHDIINTFHYIFDKFKKGLFIKILNKKLDVFLPFSKVNYQNEWYNKIVVDKTHYKNLENLIRYTAKQEHRDFNISKFNYDVKTWYGNNGLVRCEYPISEGDNGLNMLKDMLESLVRERNVPNVECYINKRDFPILKKNRTEAYDNFFGRDFNLLSHNYDKYVPILSMNTAEEYGDIPIPTWYDWSIVSYYEEKKLFAKEYCKFPEIKEFENIEWKDKKETAIFRGASTGVGTSIKNNIRLFYCYKSLLKKKDIDGQLFLDAGITKWNVRPRISLSNPYLETIRMNEINLPLVPFVSPLEQAKYKYILHLPGHSCAYRLSLELFFGSVILLYPCKYELWYFRHLKPWKHYIPIDPFKKDDIYEKISWCKKNDDKCREIAREALVFAKQWINKNTMLDYMHNVFWRISSLSFPSLYMNLRSSQDIQKEYAMRFVKKYDEYFNSCILGNKNIDLFFKNLQSSFDILNHQTIETYFYYLEEKKLLNRFIDEICSKDENVLYNSRRTEIYTFKLGGRNILIKKTCHNWQNDEWNHILLSKFILNPVRSTCDYLMYLYYYIETENNCIYIIEQKEGITLEKYITSLEFTFKDLINIWIALIIIIMECRENHCFDHLDLYPWNIMIDKSNKNIDYHDSKNQIMFSCPYRCSIIDYGKSFFIHQGLAYYNIVPFSFGPFYNVLTMIFSSLFIYLSSHCIDSNTASLIIKIMNYFSNIIPLNNQFFSLADIKYFLKYQKKFSTVMTHRLNPNKKVIDFLYYLDSLCIPGVAHIVPNTSVLYHNPIIVSENMDYYMIYLQISISNDIRTYTFYMNIPCNDLYEQIINHYFSYCISKKSNDMCLPKYHDIVPLPKIIYTDIVPYPSTCSHICFLCTQKHSNKTCHFDNISNFMKTHKISNYLNTNKSYSFYDLWTIVFRPLFFFTISNNTI